MKIPEITIENFGTIKNLQTELSTINLITGSNGSGKSTFLTALDYVLRDNDGLTRKIKTYSKFGESGFRINAHLQKNSDIFDLTKVLSKSTTNKTLIHGNDKFYNSEASEYLTKFIDPFLVSLCINRQRNDKSLLNQTPTERLKIMKSVFGLDSLTEKVELKKEEIRTLKNKIENAVENLNILRNNKFSFLPKVEIEFSKDDIDRNLIHLEELIKDWTRYQKKLSEYTLQLEKFNSYNSQKVKLETKKVQLEKEKQSLEKEFEKEKSENYSLRLANNEKEKLLIEEKLLQIKLSQRDFFNLDENIETVKKELFSLSYENLEGIKKTIEDLSKEGDETELKYLESSLKELSNQIKEIEIEKLNFENFRKNWNSRFEVVKELSLKLSKFEKKEFIYSAKDLNSQNEEIINLKNSIRDKKENLELIRLGKCPKCKQDLKSHSHSIEDIEKEILKDFESLSEKETKLKEIKDQLEEKEIYERSFDRYSDGCIGLKDLSENLSRFEKEGEKFFIGIDKESCTSFEEILVLTNSYYESFLTLQKKKYKKTEDEFNILEDNLDTLKKLTLKVTLNDQKISQKNELELKVKSLFEKRNSIDLNKLTEDKSQLESSLEKIATDSEFLNLKISSLAKLENEVTSHSKNLQEVEYEILHLVKIDEPVTPSQPVINIDEVEKEFFEWNEKRSQYELLTQKKKEVDEFNSKQEILKNENQSKIVKLETSYQENNKQYAIKEEVKKLLDKEFPSFVIESNIDFIQHKLNELFNKIYNKDYTIKFAISDSGKSVDLTYSSISTKANDEDLDSISEGEKQIVEICLRVILALMSDLKFLILDEADSFLSENVSKSLFEVILEEDFEQVFIVTHKESTKEFLINNYNSKVLDMNELNI